MDPAVFKNGQWQFTVWAPLKEKMVLHIVKPFDKELPMKKGEEGYFTIDVATEEKNFLYFFKPGDENDFPDPASHYQPEGVHGPSQTVDHSLFLWKDQSWKGLSLSNLIIYELHVGLFTQEGTFEAIIPRLDELKELGINALELMPVSQFPGDRNWGYDGVYPYAVQNSYGGPDGLKSLVNACHQKGIAVILDVVYNHLGPEGNYLPKFGPYFTTKYCTPWGDAINFDDEWTDGVREYFSENAIHWFNNYHIDGLRCDAIHAVFDNGAVHFWELVHQKVKALEEHTGKQFHLIAESDLNSPKVVKQPAEGGYGFNAQWLDDFHHALYVLINPSDGERYYDFGTMEQLIKAYNEGFVHSGEWVKFRKRRHGASSAGVPGDTFIVFNQNHDQIGNRADGKRLCMLVDSERTKLTAAAVLLAPYVPMLFMGEEYVDQSPFFYFVSHSDKDLIKAVQEGRKKEFEAFGFGEDVPDPQDEDTFLRSKINWNSRTEEPHQLFLKWHKEVIRMRKELVALKDFQKQNVEAKPINDRAFVLNRHTSTNNEKLICLFNFSETSVSYTPSLEKEAIKILDSKDKQWMPTDENSHPARISAGEKLLLLPLSITVYAVS